MLWGACKGVGSGVLVQWLSLMAWEAVPGIALLQCVLGQVLVSIFITELGVKIRNMLLIFAGDYGLGKSLHSARMILSSS